MSKTRKQAFAERFGWRKVEAPKPWRPGDLGEELFGYYGGRTIRNGQFGQYEVIIVHVPYKGAFMVSGVKIIQLIDTAMITRGHPIRITWKGLVDVGTDGKRPMKDFELLVADEPAIDEEELPEIRN